MCEGERVWQNPTVCHSSSSGSLPMTYVNSEEAREVVKGNPYSFLHVDKAEIDLDPELSPYDDRV